MPTTLPPRPSPADPSGSPYAFRRRFPGFGFVLFAVGLGLILFNALPWWRLPRYSAEDVDASAEVNLALDARRLTDAQRADPTFMNHLRAQVRGEVQDAIRKDRDAVERPLMMGLLMLVIGLVDLVFFRLRQRRARPDTNEPPYPGHRS